MTPDLLDEIICLDKQVWYAVNVLGRCSFMDILAPYLRNPLTWIPFYLFLLIFIPYRFGRPAFWWCIGFILTFAICDYTSASVIKPLVQRIRPCNDGQLKSVVHLIVDCGSGYSFPSSHASNHFGMSFFMIITLRRFWRWIVIPLILWAFSIAYSQVYVGVHFPLDVFCGGILGVLAGTAVGSVFNRRLGSGVWRLRQPA